MTLKVIDRFTTRDGKWEVDDRPFGLTKEAFDKYISWNIPGKGGAAHLFVYAPVSSEIRFYTSDGKNLEYRYITGQGWCDFPMFDSSAFWGKDNGPWSVSVNDVEVARGLGLPEGYHVSTFLIVDDVDEGSQPTPTPTPGGTVSHIQVIVDDVMVFDNWSDK